MSFPLATVVTIGEALVDEEARAHVAGARIVVLKRGALGAVASDGKVTADLPGDLKALFARPARHPRRLARVRPFLRKV
jgi:hypothetical protein